MNAPQAILLIWLGLGFGLAWADHGKPKKGTHNAWCSLIASGLLAGLLWWGGFWR
jgi:hypothetical protein